MDHAFWNRLHDLPGAREQLASGWKAYLESHRVGQARAAGVPKLASLATLVLDDLLDLIMAALAG